jgi:hypothetical protein
VTTAGALREATAHTSLSSARCRRTRRRRCASSQRSSDDFAVGSGFNVNASSEERNAGSGESFALPNVECVVR